MESIKSEINSEIDSELNLNSEIEERKLMCKTLSKYITACDYFGKTLIVLSATSGGIFIILL